MSSGSEPTVHQVARLGERLRTLRAGSGLTQAEVAERAGLSLSFVRLVEGGKSDISLSRLLQWTTVFGVPVGSLFTDDVEDEVVVIRPDERVEVPSKERGVRFLLLSPGGAHDLEPAVFELEPGAVMERTLSHEGEETGYALRGSLRIWVGDKVVDLEEGDSVYYKSHLPHRFANRGTGRAALLLTTTHPRLHPRSWTGAIRESE